MRFQKCPDSCGESIKLQEEGAEILVLSFSFCAICCSLREYPVFFGSSFKGGREATTGNTSAVRRLHLLRAFVDVGKWRGG